MSCIHEQFFCQETLKVTFNLPITASSSGGAPVVDWYSEFTTCAQLKPFVDKEWVLFTDTLIERKEEQKLNLQQKANF